MNKIIEVKNLGLKIGESVILDDISFDIEKEGILAVIGPNGAGKTTLVKCILGIMKPTSGSVKFSENLKTAYIPQKLEFERDFPISVEEFINIQHDGVLIQNDFALFSKTGVDKLFDQQLGSLSGGELQRLMIALSLAKEPDIVFMDEPAAGIDIGGEETIYSLMHDLQHEHHFAIVIISHDVEFVSKYADQVLCMNKRMMCSGKPGKVLTKSLLEETYGHELAEYTHKFEHKGYV